MPCELIDLRTDAIVGSYRLVRELGRGGMGTVYEARHAVLPRRAALKVMHAELRRQPGMATRIVQEATILESVRHPGIVRVFECSILPDHRPYIAMELAEGTTLAHRFVHSPLSIGELAVLLAEVADVLAAVHARGVVHRDLKPDNLVLMPLDREFPLRVLDWGIARLGPLGHVTLDGFTPGTPIYMSPEQAAGRDIGAPCDVYSLGVIAYEALAGRPPFDGRTLAEVVCLHMQGEAASLAEQTCAPRALCELVHRMLAKDPSLRPSALEVRQLARAVATAHAGDYETFELGAREPRHHGIDAEVLEHGPTEILPAIHRPRWTPQIAAVAAPIATGDDAPAAMKPR
ncbi:MAG TPA: serine/threonine-protein kinase [Kofleriaceae bacterium]|nr:serine/threonine-protein kinase [Kofleriaceae bacterium]